MPPGGVDVVRGVVGGEVVEVVIVGEVEEGEEVAVFSATCRVAFDGLFDNPQPAPPCDGDWAHTFSLMSRKYCAIEVSSLVE